MSMKMNSTHLEAFLAVVKKGKFSLAAKAIHITQSALSQRIMNLEAELGVTLLIRNPMGAKPTAAGDRLLRYCEMMNSLENELTQDLRIPTQNEVAGTIRIASYSSVLRSVIIPSLSTLIKSNPNIHCELIATQMHQLPLLLSRSEVDFIVTDARIDRAHLASHLLGHEKYVVIESLQGTDRSQCYLDTDETDRTTENFFKTQNKKAPKYERSFYNDCYGILEGVKMGLGRAVMSEHLLKDTADYKIIKHYSPQKVDVTLQYHQQPYYSKLQQCVVNDLLAHAKRYLNGT